MAIIEDIEESSAPQPEKWALSFESWLLCSTFDLFVINLSAVFVDAVNLFFGIYGVNPGWNWTCPLYRPPPVTNLERSEVHYDLRTVDQSVGASYNVYGNGALTVNTGAHLFIGKPKAAAGSLQELESHFKQIEPSTFRRQISFQFKRRDGSKGTAFYIGTMEGSPVVKTMSVYPRGSQTDKDWERLLSRQLESLVDVDLSLIAANIFGIVRTSFMTAVVYHGALIPLYHTNALYPCSVMTHFFYRLHTSVPEGTTLTEEQVNDMGHCGKIVLNDPRLRQVSTRFSTIWNALQRRYMKLHLYWKRLGLNHPHSVFVCMDTGQLVVTDSQAEWTSRTEAGYDWSPPNLDRCLAGTLGKTEYILPDVPGEWKEIWYSIAWGNAEDTLAEELLACSEVHCPCHQQRCESSRGV